MGFKNITGQKFNRLMVLERADNDSYGNARWLCECSCENHTKIIVRGTSLRNGSTKSCGCLNTESRRKIGKLNKKYNTYNLSGKYGIGYTNKGEPFYFDLEDYNKIKDYCWYKDNYGYIVSKNKTNIKLHRLITNCPNNLYVDHIHGNKTRYDNRKENLRICTNQENIMNQCIKSNNSSGITGVDFDKKSQKWHSRITINYQNIHLGYFDNIKDAIAVRKEAEEKYFGKYSYDNSIKTNKVIYVEVIK